MENMRLKFSCLIISLGIALMPKNWRNKKAINNLMAVNCIKNVKPPTQ